MTKPMRPIAVNKSNLSKKEIKSRIEQESKLKLSRNALIEPPAWLDNNGKAEFARVVYEAGQINLLDNLDLSVLAIYANAYSKYVESVIAIQNQGMTVKRVSRYDEYESLSPWAAAQEKYVKQIMLCSTKLGLACTDRLKLIVPSAEPEQKENKFLQFVK